MRPLIFGEVLFDRFPDGTTVLGGAPFNVAWHLQALGLAPLVVTRVGRDDLGDQVLDAMADWGLDRRGVQRDATRPTGTVEVTFDDGEPSYEITADVAYDFIDADTLPDLGGAWLLYHGTLAARRRESAAALVRVREGVAGARFVDVNLRAPWWERERVLAVLRGADWVKLNADELRLLHPDGDEAARRAALAGSVTRHLVLTAGEDGAVVLDPQGREQIVVRPARTTEVVDTVGAGDAFSGVFLAGHLLEWPLDETLRRAQEFASAIVGVRGATPWDRDLYGRFRRAWGIEAD